MSLFTDLVVKEERRKLRALDGVMPLIEISRERERRLKLQILGITGIWLFALIVVVSNQLFHHERDEFVFRNDLTLNFVFLLIAITIGFAVMVWIMIREAIKEAADERTQARKAKAAKVAADEAKKAAEAAEKARQQALVLAEQGKRQQALHDFRVNALMQMESGLKELLYDHRERAEWIPERADEEHLYEMIRKRFSQAGKDVPELGLLRRSSDPLVIMILGDRSFLPKEPSDEVLARRQLPPVVKLLN